MTPDIAVGPGAPFPQQLSMSQRARIWATGSVSRQCTLYIDASANLST